MHIRKAEKQENRALINIHILGNHSLQTKKHPFYYQFVYILTLRIILEANFLSFIIT